MTLIIITVTTQGFRPRESTYVQLVSACERRGQWKIALSIYDDMRRREVVFYDVPLLDSLFKRLVRAWSSQFDDEGDVDQGSLRDGVEALRAWSSNFHDEGNAEQPGALLGVGGGEEGHSLCPEGPADGPEGATANPSAVRGGSRPSAQ